MVFPRIYTQIIDQPFLNHLKRCQSTWWIYIDAYALSFANKRLLQWKLLFSYISYILCGFPCCNAYNRTIKPLYIYKKFD